MSDIESQIEEVEVNMDDAKSAIAIRDALVRLGNDPDFSTLMLKGYFEKEASRLVLLKADPNMQSPEDQTQILNSINAIGYVRLYFHTIMQLGNMMERGLKEDQATREELLQEQ